jgi:putative oxidoreductase
MFRKLFQTYDDSALAFLRLVLGLVFFAHGAQKVLGWFGGPGYAGAMNMFTNGLGFPPVLGAIAIWTEFAGGLLLIIGFIARIDALAIGIEMVVAIVKVHAANGFFMNWAGTQHGEGFEYHLLVIAMAVLLVARGAGAFSVDHALMCTGRTHPTHPHPYPAPSGD